MKFFLIIAAIVVFVLVAILAFATTTSIDTEIGLTAAGLGAWAASTIAPA